MHDGAISERFDEIGGLHPHRRLRGFVAVGAIVLAVAGCAGPARTPTASEPTPSATWSTSDSTDEVSDPSSWAGLPIEREVTSPDGWSYAFTIESLPDMSVETDVSNSPPGSARLVLASSGAFTATSESLDVGRNAPELQPRLDVIGWNPPNAPEALTTEQYRQFAPLAGDVMEGAMACQRPLRSSARVECSTGDWVPAVNPSGESDAQVETQDMPEDLASELQATVLTPAHQYATIIVANEYGNCLDVFFVLASGEQRPGECNSRVDGP